MTTTTELSPYAAEAARTGLPALGKRPTLGKYLRQVRTRLPFAIELARSRFRAENEADRLGIAWIVLRPLINAAVYGVVFSLLLSGKKDANYVGFLVAGVFIFQYFASCLTDGSRAIVQNMGLVTTLHFPRALLPISVVVQQSLAMGPMVLVMILVVGISKAAHGQPVVTPEWVVAVPGLALMALFNLGLAFFAARVTIHVRDLAQLIPFITRIFFYVSGVLISVKSMARGNPAAQELLSDNPLSVYIEMIREPILHGKLPTAHEWIWGVGWAVVMLVFGFIWFWRAEELYGRE